MFNNIEFVPGDDPNRYIYILKFKHDVISESYAVKIKQEKKSYIDKKTVFTIEFIDRIITENIDKNDILIDIVKKQDNINEFSLLFSDENGEYEYKLSNIHVKNKNLINFPSSFSSKSFSINVIAENIEKFHYV